MEKRGRVPKVGFAQPLEPLQKKLADVGLVCINVDLEIEIVRDEHTRSIACPIAALEHVQPLQNQDVRA